MKIIFDIGGTNMRFSSIFDGKVGEILKVLTPQDLESAKKLIKESISKVANGVKIESIVGGFPGSVKNGTLISAPNLPKWNSFSFEVFLKENFCERVHVYNDADLAGLGESIFGAGKGSSIVAYIGVGTGVGGARIIDGEFDKNSMGFGVGHHILDINNRKTLEDIVSGRGILAQYGKKAEEIGQVEIKKLTPVLAVGLYNTIRFWSPDVLVIGGSLVNDETAFKMDEIDKDLRAIRINKTLPPLKKAELGDSSGLWGALVMTERLNK